MLSELDRLFDHDLAEDKKKFLVFGDALLAQFFEEVVDLPLLGDRVVDLRQLDPLLEVFPQSILKLARNLCFKLLEDVANVELEHL